MNDIVNRTVNALEKIGVKVADEDGELRDMVDILDDLSNAWINMNQEKKLETINALMIYSMEFTRNLGNGISSSLTNINNNIH